MKLSLQAPSVTALKIRFRIRNDIKSPKDDLLPGGWMPVLRDSVSRKAEMFRWGISEARMGANDRLVFATKIENMLTEQGRHLLERRLVVPVESFQIRSDGKTHRIFSRDRQPLALAAVWDVDGHWRGRPVRAFRLITGPIVDGFEQAGARMPVVLRPENESTWLWHFTEEEQALDALEPHANLEAT